MDKELKRHYTLLVDFLGHVMGPDYEIALHELKDDSNEIIAIANGELTGRHLGSPLSTKMLEYLAARRRTMCWISRRSPPPARPCAPAPCLFAAAPAS